MNYIKILYQKGYFNTAIDTGSCKNADSKLKESEINQKLREISLQGDVLKYVYNVDNSLPKILASLSLFGIDEEKIKIADYILYKGNFDLTFRILKEFSIDMVTFYKNAAIRHAKAGRFDSALDVITSIKVILIFILFSYSSILLF